MYLGYHKCFIAVLLLWSARATEGLHGLTCTNLTTTCTFPFIYKEREYTSCAYTDGFSWCSATANFQGDARAKGVPCYDCNDLCTNTGCGKNEYRCGCPFDDKTVRHGIGQSYVALGQCIPRNWVCDGISDCPDQSDELYCFCEPGQLQCGCKRPAERCAGGAGCYNSQAEVCDGTNNCADGTDEVACRAPLVDCPCAEGDVHCLNNTTAIPLTYVCDGTADCPHATDETNCSCTGGTYPCGNGVCMDKIRFCDGNNDCGDWTDEDLCPGCPSNMFLCSCFNPGNITCTSYEGCLKQSDRCNGFANCGDASDEENCTCPSGEVDCPCTGPNCFNGSSCVSPSFRCDGYQDCPGWAEELNCSIPEGTFVCDCYLTADVTGLCLQPASKVCDGVKDCDDDSDEADCNCTTGQFECACHRNGTRCFNGRSCVSTSRLCDGYADCPDHSDEDNCTCPFQMTPCARDNTTCIHNDQMCDGVAQCPGGTDEPVCNCVSNRRQCPGLEKCVSENFFCDGENDCGGWEDEVGCAIPPGTFACRCLNGSCMKTYVQQGKVCDRVNNCGDWSDEIDCPCSGLRCGCITAAQNETCNATGQCIDASQLVDGVRDCLDETDEPCAVKMHNCKTCQVKTAQCITQETSEKFLTYERMSSGFNATCTFVSGSNNSGNSQGKWACFTHCQHDRVECTTPLQCENDLFVPLPGFCDRRQDCSDGSDERPDSMPGFKCIGMYSAFRCVLPQSNLYDDITQCKDGSDQCLADGKMKCFSCFDGGMVISRRQVCDGVADCHDLSDECFCDDQTVCEAVFDNFASDCPHGMMPCANQTDCVKLDTVLCNGVSQCMRGVDEMYCTLATSTDQGKNINCSTKYGLTQATRCDKRPECRDMSDECVDCPDKPAFCNDSCRFFYPMGDRYCDGIRDDAWAYINDSNCGFGFDERSCPTRRDCGDGTTVDVRKMCDGVIDCLNGMDEVQQACPNRFYCWNGQPLSVDVSRQYDGFADCSDGSDETGLFSSLTEMIANPVLRVLIWIMGILACFANLIVAISTIRKLITNTTTSSFVRVNQILVINLALSDFIMGVYLLTLAINSARFSGNYWLHDKPWRFGNLCNALGCMVVIASEASILFMAVLTTFRLMTIRNPLSIASNKSLKLVAVVLLVWGISVTLAVLPLADNLSGYFSSGAWFPNPFTKSEIVDKQALRLMATRMYRYDGRVPPSDPLSWHQILEQLETRFDVKAQVGYYSENSVCMPRFFGRNRDDSSHFSTVLLTINLLLFIYIAFAYAHIYKASNNRVQSSETNRSRKMQKRITRLIATDFCCWIPLCVLAYINLAGVQLPVVVYAISAIVLLPINSVLNPILYSSALGKFFHKCKSKVQSSPGQLNQFSTSDRTVISTIH